MATLKLDHVSVLTRDIDASVRFYEDVLGLKVGPRPNIPFPGAWLYQEDRAVVHIMVTDAFDIGPTAGFDHIAFNATGVAEYKDRFDRLGLTYRTNYAADVRLTQFFLKDPAGVTIEMNFFNTDAPEGWSKDAMLTSTRG
jgi:catechol 2,3-dioxygenase-like lactoylglutathione lyase family enzyme